MAEPLADFAAVQAAFAAFDPLGALEDAIKAAEESVTRVLASLDPVKLVESPQAIFDDIIGALQQLDVGKLIGADLRAARRHRRSRSTPDWRAPVAAFKRLQDALPDRDRLDVAERPSANASVN